MRPGNLPARTRQQHLTPSRLSTAKPERASALLRQTYRLVSEGVFSPLPVETFPVRVTDGWVEIGLTGSLGPAGGLA